MIMFNQDQCGNLEFARSREWLVTNGIGGYASGTVSGMNTRRYHGLLVAATQPPLGRMVMLSQLEDTLVVNGERYPLSTNLYVGDVVYPRGYLSLVDFRLDPHPVFTYGNGEWEISRAVRMVAGENTTVIEYSLRGRSARDEVHLEVRPLIAFRDYHSTTHENEALSRAVMQHEDALSFQPYVDLPALLLNHGGATVETDGCWYRNFEYERERERGLDRTEDLFSPLLMRVSLCRRDSFQIRVSVSERANEQTVRGTSAPESSAPPAATELIESLTRAANQFIVTRPPFKTTIAGYHWFGDWGRDTMVSLPGLFFQTGQPELSKEVFLQYARYIDGGMLPNRFPDSGAQPEYNTVDAALWFINAVGLYVNNRSDESWLRESAGFLRSSLYEPLREIVHHYGIGTRYGIHSDDNGFLWAGDNSTQLTWMDARVGGVPVTPRHGRPVEIQALWYNALRTLAEFATLLGDPQNAAMYTVTAAKLKAAFTPAFWNSAGNCLFDVAGNGGVDDSIRPNQLFAVSLRYPLLSGHLAREVVETAEAELLTPFGLRTLAATNRNYRGTYQGDVAARDGAYHQGTVWPWLAGPFFRAKLAVSENPERVLRQIDEWLETFATHLADAGVGQISEIFDGDFPHEPRGCIAQAWSVAEILNLAKMGAARSPQAGERE